MAVRIDSRMIETTRERAWWVVPTLCLSHRVIAERKDPYLLEGYGPERSLVGDRFVASYLYGPLGMLSRSQEFENSDPKDNRDHYYLPDVTDYMRI